ncbi:MAG TPA: hypothetical protein VJ867_17865 [Gemmatimonadaceae bacterium]|nr:hypothetical protein [Gemmatimonadaceae bacterium]
MQGQESPTERDPASSPLEVPSPEAAPVAPRTTRASLGNRRVAMRVVRTPPHGMVLVYEADPVPGEPRSSLIFETGGSQTRLAEFPSEWRRLSDADLLALPSGQQH